MLGKHSEKCLSFGGKYAKSNSFFGLRHSKKYLAALAAVLAVAVGCGGTLMLLTHETPTAKNVMTAGNVEGELHEVVAENIGDDFNAEEDKFGVSGDDSSDIYTMTEDGEVALGNIAPNQPIIKNLYVKNTGSADAYVAIELIFSMGESYSGSEAESKAEAFFDNINFNGAHSLNGAQAYPGDGPWRTTDSCTVQSESERHKIYFYAKGSGYDVSSKNGLVPISHDGKTEAFLIDDIKFPNTWTEEEINGATLKIKAYMIQSDWVSDAVGQNSNESYWRTFFKNQFTGLKNIY
ncbi:MAG: hypothetical protein LBG82_03995 [Clostridiales Family XIII bacterium]|jgi:hypothetical protein|nr:hypothetical protein [Clostridiales Family XIII bacterium]